MGSERRNGTKTAAHAKSPFFAAAAAAAAATAAAAAAAAAVVVAAAAAAAAVAVRMMAVRDWFFCCRNSDPVNMLVCMCTGTIRGYTNCTQLKATYSVITKLAKTYIRSSTKDQL